MSGRNEPNNCYYRCSMVVELWCPVGSFSKTNPPRNSPFKSTNDLSRWQLYRKLHQKTVGSFRRMACLLHPHFTQGPLALTFRSALSAFFPDFKELRQPYPLKRSMSSKKYQGTIYKTLPPPVPPHFNGSQDTGTRWCRCRHRC